MCAAKHLLNGIIEHEVDPLGLCMLRMEGTKIKVCMDCREYARGPCMLSDCTLVALSSLPSQRIDMFFVGSPTNK